MKKNGYRLYNRCEQKINQGNPDFGCGCPISQGIDVDNMDPAFARAFFHPIHFLERHCNKYTLCHGCSFFYQINLLGWIVFLIVLIEDTHDIFTKCLI